MQRSGRPTAFLYATAFASVDNFQQYVTLGKLTFGGQAINYTDTYPDSGFDVAFGDKDYETDPFAGNYNGLAGGDRVSLFENLLLSSAVITKQANGIPEFPRRQGTGLANVKNSMTTPVIPLGDCGKSKISLGGEIGSSFPLNFTVRNLTEQAVTYDELSLDVLTDRYKTADGQNYVAPMVRLSAQSDVPQSVTVPAGGEQQITVKVTLDPTELAANAAIFKSGFYIDGYVSLSKSDDSICTVSLTDFQQLAGMTLVDLDLTDRSVNTVEGILIAAFYDKDNRLVQVMTEPVTIEPGTKPVTLNLFGDTTNAATMRVLLWDGLGGMQPLFAGRSFQIA